jgi:hypothetical protein
VFTSSVCEFGLSTPKCLDPLFSATANLEVVEWPMATSDPNVTAAWLAELGHDRSPAQRDARGLRDADFVATEAAELVHGTCTQGALATSIGA